MKLKDLKSLIASALGAGRDLIAAHRQLTQQHAQLSEERRALLAAPAPRAELIAALDAEVDRRAAAWAASHGPLLLRTIGFDLEMDGSPSPRPARLPGEFEMGPLDFAALCGLCPSVVKDRLHQLLDGLNFDNAEPMGTRLSRAAELDRRILEVEDEHSELCDSAAALEPAIVLPLLEPVRLRRALQTYRRGLEERDARDHAARKVRA